MRLSVSGEPRHTPDWTSSDSILTISIYDLKYRAETLLSVVNTKNETQFSNVSTMFSSFSSFSNPFRLPRFLSSGSSAAVAVDPVEVHDVEIQHDKRARTLKHLLRLNHVNNSILYHDLEFDNHMPHILGSAYLFNAEPEHLNDIYNEESKELEPWKDSPGEVSTYDWRDYLGDRRYQRAYVDFFEDELVLNGYDWRKVLVTYLFKGKEPLINNLISG
ncbi:MAG: hypothetical protein L6R42_008011, partial [Xanthoria sp. 1 TBL-2021]